MPQDTMDASLLFENNNNVKFSSSRSHHSQQNSSPEASQSPTSESEGMFDNPGHSSEEKVDNDSNFPGQVSVPSQGSNMSKSGQVSTLHILSIFHTFFSLSNPASEMLH